LKVEVVNGEEPEKAKHRVAFDNLAPALSRVAAQSSARRDLSMRVMDILSPSQRPAGLIVRRQGR